MEATIFEEALKLPGPRREQYLAEACEGNEALRQRVLELVRAAEEAGGFLTEGTGTVKLEMQSDERPGQIIGRYKLLQQIGEGGCGVVYMAEQEEPVRRRVALKVIKQGMDTREVIARFEAERQALAMMDHPNIARVLDAGATEAGRPYFVMELVRGIKITEYCDQHNLSTEKRLELFMSICHAVQHAHQKGIIHRDIKPSNILITLHDGVPVPKIIDFGIAKATEGKLTDKTLFTAFHQFIGTPAYMSPEQAEMSGLDIDTRSDIYSLGVLLYELLTGEPPFDARELAAAGLDEIRRRIREEEPHKPSTRLSTMVGADLTTVARHRQTDAPRLVHAVTGDLDWIVMKALEKDRTRRYETAGAFAVDVKRHLENDVVSARPPSRAYQFCKLVRRNKAAFTTLAAVACALIIGLISSLILFRRESTARAAAERAEQDSASQALKSQQITKFLSEMLKGIGPSVALGRDTTVLKEILGKAETRLANELGNDPETKAELLSIISDVQREISNHSRAEAAARESLSLRTALFGREHRSVAQSWKTLADTLHHTGPFKEHEEAVFEALRIRRNLFGTNHLEVAESLRQAAFHLGQSGKVREAAAMAQEALEISRRLAGEVSEAVAESYHTMGYTHFFAGQWAAAKEAFVKHRQLKATVFGKNSHEARTAIFHEALVLQSQGDFEAAETAYQNVISEWESLYGVESPALVIPCINLANVLDHKGEPERVLLLVERGIRLESRFFGESKPAMAMLLMLKGRALWSLRRLEQAENEIRRSLSIIEKVRPREHPDAHTVKETLASFLRQNGKLAEATKLYLEIYETETKKPKGEDYEAGAALRDLAFCALAEKDYRKADAYHRQMAEFYHERQGTNSLALYHLETESLASRRDWRAVLRQMRSRYEKAPQPISVPYIALVEAAADDWAAYKRTREQVFQDCRDLTNRHALGVAASVSLLKPVEDPQPLQWLGRIAEQCGTPIGQEKLFGIDLPSIASYRQGQFANAIEASRALQAKEKSWRQVVPALCVEAMAHQKLGEHSKALAAQARVMEIMLHDVPQFEHGSFAMSNGVWVCLVMCHILMEEMHTTLAASVDDLDD